MRLSKRHKEGRQLNRPSANKKSKREDAQAKAKRTHRTTKRQTEDNDADQGDVDFSDEPTATETIQTNGKIITTQKEIGVA